MTPREAVILVRYVEACCPQQKFDEFSPDAWHDLLGDLALGDCRAAARAVAQRQPFVAPSEIRAEVKAIREARLGPPGPGLSPIPPPADPDDDKAYRAALREQQTRIANGTETAPAIEAGAPASYDDNPHVQRILATYRAEQDAAARRKRDEAEHEQQQVRAYLAALQQLLALPDLGKRAIEAARDELFGDAQAAQGFPLLANTAGVMDEHKVTVHAAALVRDGQVA
ncbi:MAG TPA: hypothetical protein VIP77_15320 [Jiangellaceae bacterium]